MLKCELTGEGCTSTGRFLVGSKLAPNLTHLIHIVGCVLLNVAHPVPDIVEGCFIRDIVHQQNAHGPSVVSCTPIQHPLYQLSG